MMTASDLPLAQSSRTRSIFALAWFVGVVVVFFSLPLPNHPTVSRMDLWRELPFLLLNLISQNPDGPETSWANLPQRFPLIAAASVALFGAWGLGQLLLRLLRVPLKNRSLERFVLGCGIGLSGVSLIVLGLGLLAQSVSGAMSRPVLVSMLLVFGLAELVIFLRERGRKNFSAAKSVDTLKGKTKGKVNQDDDPGVLAGGQISYGQIGRVIAISVIASFCLAIVFGAMLPSIDFDVKEYHLGGPKEHFQNGYISWLPHNVYTSFPFLTEMHLLLGMILCDDWQSGALAGKLILSMFGPLTALAVFVATRRWFGEFAAWSAALIHISTPWTYRISIIAYAEGGLTFYLFATLLAVDLTLDAFRSPPGHTPDGAGKERHPGSPCACMVGVTGLLAGSAMACKYPGVLQVVIPLGVALLWLVYRATRHAPGAGKTVVMTGVIYSAGVLLAVGPWLAKNFCETGNPVFPLLQSVFHGSDWSPILEANWKGAHSPDNHDPVDFFVKLSDVTFRSDWLSPLLFSLAPLTFVFWRKTAAVRGLWIYVSFLFLSWWVFTHRIDRFWIPMIPIVSVLAGAGLVWSREKLWQRASLGVLSLSVLFNLGFVSTPLCGLNHWLGDLDKVQNIASSASCPGIARLNEMLEADKVKVLLVGEAQIFDAQFPLIYNTVFDVSIFEEICSAAEPGVPPDEQPMKPSEEIRKKLVADGITHVYINWQEVLRYRMTYGYTEFVAPHRLAKLSQEGVFIGSPLVISDLADLSSMGEREQADVRKWAPELIGEYEGKEFFVTSQLYTLRK